MATLRSTSVIMTSSVLCRQQPHTRLSAPLTTGCPPSSGFTPVNPVSIWLVGRKISSMIGTCKYNRQLTLSKDTNTVSKD